MHDMNRFVAIILACFIAFALFQALFIYKRVHNYPFMIFDMYSRPEQPYKAVHLYDVVADGDTVDLYGLPLYTEGAIRNSLRLYEFRLTGKPDPWAPALDSRLARLGRVHAARTANRRLRNDDSAVEAYPGWLKEYLGRQVLGKEVNRLTVGKRVLEPGSGRLMFTQTLIDE